MQPLHAHHAPTPELRWHTACSSAGMLHAVLAALLSSFMTLLGLTAPAPQTAAGDADGEPITRCETASQRWDC